MLKITDVITTDSETSSEIDIVSTINASDDTKERIKEEVGDYLMEQTFLSVGSLKSPISGHDWKKTLSPEYKKKKIEEGGTPVANLEMTGGMLSALEYELTEDGIKIGVFGKEALKADGHNNLSGESQLPERRFLPGEGEKYKREIEQGVTEIINDILAEEATFSEKDFEGVDSSDELFDVLEELTGVSGKAAITRSVLANESLRELLSELDLLDLLDA